MPSQPNRLLIPSVPSSTPRPLPLGGRATPKALRPREWTGLTNDEILSRFVCVFRTNVTEDSDRT